MLEILYRSFDTITNFQAVYPEYSHLPFMGNPLKLLALILFYLYFVQVRGKEFMRNRKPFDLNHILLIYNGFQIIANLSLGLYVFYKMNWVYVVDLTCITSELDNSPKGKDEFFVTYCYFILKILDLMDTVFFVLRKKFNQITLLHIYHHVLMCCGICFAVQAYPAGHGGVMGLINCYVHVIMYSYYFVTAKIKLNQNKSLWWKKHITQIQIIQFILIALYMLIPLIKGNCLYPSGYLWAILIQNSVMTILFLDFYVKEYAMKPKLA